jgi:hypothetical protein
MRQNIRISSVAFLALALCTTTAHAQTGKLTVELNKFENADNGTCKAFFLFRNETGKSFAGFEVSLAILDQTGIIDQLLSNCSRFRISDATQSRKFCYMMLPHVSLRMRTRLIAFPYLILSAGPLPDW